MLHSHSFLSPTPAHRGEPGQRRVRSQIPHSAPKFLPRGSPLRGEDCVDLGIGGVRQHDGVADDVEGQLTALGA